MIQNRIAISVKAFILSKQLSKHGRRNQDSEHALSEIKVGALEGKEGRKRGAILGRVHREGNWDRQGIKEISRPLAGPQKRSNKQ
jgi:hypothetical protein